MLRNASESEDTEPDLPALNINGTGTLLSVESEGNMTVNRIKSGNDKFLLECTLTDDSSALNIESIEFLDSSEGLNYEVESAPQGNSIPDNPQDVSIYQESSSENSSEGQAVIVPLASPSDNVAHEEFEPEVTSTPHKQHKRQYTPAETLRRLSKPQTWKRNVNKEKIGRGEEYITPKGKIMKANTLQPPCGL